jgi:hypothetical protein
MKPTLDPRQPKPGANSLAAKGTTDTQSADNDSATNLPRPDSLPAADSPADDSATVSLQIYDAPADPMAAYTHLESPGESDPGASNTCNDEPL